MSRIAAPGVVDGGTGSRSGGWPVSPSTEPQVTRSRRVAAGLTLPTLELGLAPGTYVIGADLVINEYLLDTDYLTLTIANDPPVVSLGPDREVDMNRTLTVVAAVTDTEDGSCPLSACTCSWDPARCTASSSTSADR